VGRAGGRGGDFLTSPEVGPLFGALVAERIDREWDALGRPSTFVVVECGAGPGTLARSIAFAAPRCAESMRYVLVEVSPAQRALHADHLAGWVGEVDEFHLAEFLASGGSGPRFASSTTMPGPLTGVVIANELLDNLPFDIVRHDGRGVFERIDVDLVDPHGDDATFEFAVAAIELEPDEAAVIATAPVGEWLPLQRRAREWVRTAIDHLERGVLVVIDYGASSAELAARPAMGWLRTFADNERAGHPLDGPGTRDITADVAIDQLSIDHVPNLVTTQAEYLRELGIDALVEEGRRVWTERASAPDVTALRARSRIGEAEALTERGGLGEFMVLEWGSC
jgi:SAM-dependent MidA family methyltransferase